MAKECTVIVPTWNMGRFLSPLFHSIAQSAFAPRVREVLFVCDGSTDGSQDIVRALAAGVKPGQPRVRLIEPEGGRREGAFHARYLGAKAAESETIFFVDSRVTFSRATTDALPDLLDRYPAVNSNVDIDVNKNIYSLYWKRSHAKFFRSEALVREVFEINSANYEQRRFGTGCFFCPREVFLRACEKFGGMRMWSDDTYLLRELVREQPVVMHPAFRINWEPRDRLLPFLMHLFNRGPGLAQYHLFRQRGPIFYAVLGALVFGVGIIAAACAWPILAAVMVLFALVAAALSTALFTSSLVEFIKLAPLHVAVLAFYGFGALRGAWVVWRLENKVDR